MLNYQRVHIKHAIERIAAVPLHSVAEAPSRCAQPSQREETRSHSSPSLTNSWDVHHTTVIQLMYNVYIYISYPNSTIVSVSLSIIKETIRRCTVLATRIYHIANITIRPLYRSISMISPATWETIW